MTRLLAYAMLLYVAWLLLVDDPDPEPSCQVAEACLDDVDGGREPATWP